ncbi:MAG: DEAD/DEAH box helicase, partial [Bacteroidota bacterium]
MDAFLTHQQVLADYKDYLKSFIQIKDEEILQKVEEAFDGENFIPEPLLQFNPTVERGESLSDLVAQGKVHQELPRIFGEYNLYRHQVEALKIGIDHKGFIVTSGTGSGKSLTYLATVFNYLLQLPAQPSGIKAILVYPMNALINSQLGEIEKFASRYGEDFPISFRRYTGQESAEARDQIKANPPDILLTNYMMLELIMTRETESWIRESIAPNLKFLVFDELHTYKGRQGSDVSMLIRRIKGLAQNNLICIGTSATMASEG